MERTTADGPTSARSIPVISVTDLYHPPEDPGDNFDLIMPFGLSEIDLRAVILDALEEKRGVTAHGVEGFPGPRDPGVVPVAQLNAIFGRSVPWGIGPFSRMASPSDTMRAVPPFQQRGIELILETLRASEERVHILSFGSARTIAAAYNRDPALFRAKLARIHISAGTTTPTFLEWNIEQDPNAIICLLRSDLPLALYPCATAAGCCGYDRHNTFYWLPNLRWVAGMHPQLRRYLGFAIGREQRMDFLRALEEELPAEVMRHTYERHHAVWETAIWARVANRRIVRRAHGEYRLVRADEVLVTDSLIRNDLVPCTTEVRADGLYSFTLSEVPTGRLVFQRDDPREYEAALQEALPALYQSFQPGDWRCAPGRNGSS